MPGHIRSIERAAAVLGLLSGRSRRRGVVELAGELGLPKGTVFGILKTLRAVGLVEQDVDSGKYQLGPALLPMSSSYLDGNELRMRGRGAASNLAVVTGESVRVAALHQNEVLILHQVIPRRRRETREAREIGNLLPVKGTALGEVLTANHGDAISERGWASTIGGLSPGFASVAAPIGDRDGVTVGAIGIHGPMERLCRDRGPRADLVDHVVEAARAVSGELGAGPG
ncbi:MAG: helix-turn-helix domain-containing protein [Solirubrobacterales bacterium]|nr:helix-turn-helix domain-containing protein [Solirubrobacterales bacterium]